MACSLLDEREHCASLSHRRSGSPSGDARPTLRIGFNTTVAFWMRGSDLLPDSRERMDERRVDRGNIGAVGRIVAGGKGAHAPVIHAGTGGGLGGAVFFWGGWGGGGASRAGAGPGPRGPPA